MLDMMDPVLQTAFNNKTMTSDEAVKLVKSGDSVFLGLASSVPYELGRALNRRSSELEDVSVIASTFTRRLFDATASKSFQIYTFFMGLWERELLRSGQSDFTSVHLSQVDQFFNKTTQPNVAFFEVSPPDKHGYMSLGPSAVSVGRFVRETAKTIVVQINRNTPFVHGMHHLIHISEVDAVVYHDEDLLEVPNTPISKEISDISNYLLDQIPDGACIQLGVGSIANAVGFGLTKKNDLGIHTELLTEACVELIKCGAVNNSRKNYIPGRSVAGFALGTKEFYRYLDHNPDIYFMPFPDVNNPYTIAKNDNMISVNSALSVDLFGQVNADNIAGQQYSATGGQVDFVRGAQMSKGGKSFIALTSTYENKAGLQSRIVSRLAPGSAVTTPRSDVQYIVTEHGCINLKPLSMKERVHAMISLADPAFRPQLTEDAKAMGLF